VGWRAWWPHLLRWAGRSDSPRKRRWSRWQCCTITHQHPPCLSTVRATKVTYRGFEKSCGRSLGPSGTLFLPLSAALLMAGGGRAALMAFEALVLRSLLPWSAVFWNLRTRSSTRDTVSMATRGKYHPHAATYQMSRSILHPRHSTLPLVADL
jgi:hypothetical protein